GAAQKVVQLRLDRDDVLLELQQHVQRLADQVGRERVGVQQHQGAGPVDGLGDRRNLAKLDVAQRLHEGHQLAGQLRLDARHAGGDDLLLQVRVRQRNVQVQAAALQGVAQ